MNKAIRGFLKRILLMAGLMRQVTTMNKAIRGFLKRILSTIDEQTDLEEIASYELQLED